MNKRLSNIFQTTLEKVRLIKRQQGEQRAEMVLAAKTMM